MVCFYTPLQKRKQLAKLTAKEQFVFTLVRLRRNPSLEMLCDIFGITTGTGSRIFITWILFLEKELGFFYLSQQGGIERDIQTKLLQKGLL